MLGQGIQTAVAVTIPMARTDDEGTIDVPQHEDAGKDEAADAEPVAHHTVRRALQWTKCSLASPQMGIKNECESYPTT